MASSIRLFILIFIIMIFLERGWCNLLSKPTDDVIVSGDISLFNCSSNSSKGVYWTFIKPLMTEPEYVSSQGKIVGNFSNYISLVNEENGRLDLKVNASRRAAGRYICTDKETSVEASAELIVLESEPKCTVIIGDDFVNSTCIVKFSGNWNPVMEWKQRNGSEMVDVGAYEVNLIPNQEAASTTSLPRNHSLEERFMTYQSQCTIIFRKSESLIQSRAENVPKYNYTWMSPFMIYGETDCNGIQMGGKTIIVVTIVVSVVIVVILMTVIIRNYCRKSAKCSCGREFGSSVPHDSSSLQPPLATNRAQEGVSNESTSPSCSSSSLSPLMPTETRVSRNIIKMAEKTCSVSGSLA